jgi:protein-tyrosine phosphatase
VKGVIVGENKVRHIHGPIFLGPGVHVEALVRESEKAENHGLLSRMAILNVADDYEEMPHHRDTIYVHAGLNDGPPNYDEPWGEHNSPNAYINAVQALDFLCDKMDMVYVHCHGGNSRSCVIVCVYFAWVYEVPFEVAEEAVKRRYDRVRIHPKHREIIAHLMQMVKTMPQTCRLYWRDKLGADGFLKVTS